ncbi:MAG: universal stress protein, partial [Anaerolineae bacterium]|nr:universal stress protein [Anaerolineae bacterium]
GIFYCSRTLQGQARQTICAQAQAGQQLTVVGPLDRPLLKRWIQGRSFRRIQKEIQTPLLYVKKNWRQMQKILLCMGGLGYATDAENWAIFLTHQLKADLTILHVIEPISYTYPTAQLMQENWMDILATDTPQGENLRRGLALAQAAGIEPRFKTRHGDTVHEILAEVDHDAYDLVVLGSPHSSQSLRHLYMPNVTAEVAERVPCPVLTVEYGQKLIF